MDMGILIIVLVTIIVGYYSFKKLLEFFGDPVLEYTMDKADYNEAIEHMRKRRRRRSSKRKGGRRRRRR